MRTSLKGLRSRTGAAAGSVPFPPGQTGESFSRAAARNGNWEGEGFGRVYVEAALAAKPIVGSLGGGAAEAVLPEKTGLLVEPSSAEQIASAIIRLLESPAAAIEMGQAGRKWARENFTEDALRRSLGGLLRASGLEESQT